MKLTDLFTPEEFAQHACNKQESGEEVKRIGAGILPYCDALTKHTSMPDEIILHVCMALALADSLLESKNESNYIN